MSVLHYIEIIVVKYAYWGIGSEISNTPVAVHFIQLFREWLSQKSVKVNAVMSKLIIRVTMVFHLID